MRDAEPSGARPAAPAGARGMGTLAFVRNNARWLTGGLVLTFSSCAGQTFFIAVFAGEIRAELGLSHGEFGGIYMGATLASAATMIWLGKLADIVPLGRLAGAAMVALAAVAFAVSQIETVWAVLVAIYGLRLLGQGMMFHTAMTAMGRWFDAERGRAVSIAALGFPLGEALLPLSMVGLMAWIGWRQTWMVVAAALILVLTPIAVALLARPRAPRGQNALARSGPEIRQWTRSEVLRDPLLYLLLMGLLAPPFVGTGIFFHQAHLVEVKGWTLALFASGFPVGAAVAVCASLGAGWAIDRWSAVRLLPYHPVALALGQLTLGLGGDPWVVFVFFACNGTSMGVSTALVGALWAELYGTRHLGAIRAAVSGAFVASTALAPGIMGALIDAGVGIEHQILGLAAYAGALIGFFLVVSRRLRRRTGQRGAA